MGADVGVISLQKTVANFVKICYIIRMFSKAGTYKAVGLFSLPHIISIFVCLFLIVLVVILTRKMQKQTYFKMLAIFAIVFSCLELFKIGWSLAQGNRNLDSWLPLYFCSLFIYSLWFSLSQKRFVRQMGLSFIALAGIVAGLAFIIFPTTSFNAYPIWHFQCLYSMLYHSAFVYCGVMFYVVKCGKVNLKFVGSYAIYCTCFMLLGVIVNSIFGCNMMFLNNPALIPIEVLRTIYNFSHVLYSFIMFAVYLLLGVLMWLVYVVVGKLRGALSRKAK